LYESKPWLKFYGDVAPSLDYPPVTLSEALLLTAERVPDAVAWDYFGTKATYREFAERIEQAARALSACGLCQGDRITISMPNSPQAVIAFYAANKLGAVCSMIHPLSPPKDIAFYLKQSKSKFALTLDAFYPAFAEVLENTPTETLILCRVPDYLPFPKNLGFRLTKGREIKPVPPDARVRWWSELMRGTYAEPPASSMRTEDLAVIMYSGGTTGVPKGVMLSNENFIAEGMQAVVWASISEGDSMLAILPIFHGFGLGVCINAVFLCGGKSILVPTFTPESVAKLIKKEKPSLLVGVPTLYEALTRDPTFQAADLKCIKGAFCGADQLPRKVKEKFEGLVADRGGRLKLLEGYGLIEAVSAIMCMPMSEYREGSIGIPFPDMLAKVVKVGTRQEVAAGKEGEICVSGPAVMMGYLENEAETSAALKKHADGLTWLHTGDIASMDEDGFFYFKLRLKRMIKSSGMNVYPSRVEQVLTEHPAVAAACVIGVPDEKQVQRVKGFVVLKVGFTGDAKMEKALVAHCRAHLIKWSCPREIEFRAELPKTLVGKLDFKLLEEQELTRLREAGEYTGQ
jgi:long-chain acyl-CoA synthetase